MAAAMMGAWLAVFLVGFVLGRISVRRAYRRKVLAVREKLKAETPDLERLIREIKSKGGSGRHES